MPSKVKGFCFPPATTIVFLIANYIYSTQSQGLGILTLKFLTDSCGAIPSETVGTGQWTAAIFLKNKISSNQSNFDDLEFLHTGAIVRPNIVFTVLKLSANGSHFIGENGTFLSKLYVVAGINASDSKSVLQQKDVQVREVDQLIPYLNIPGNLPYKLVLLHLSTPLNLENSVAKSICLPLTNIFPPLLNIPEQIIAYVRGFAISNEGQEDFNGKEPMRFTQTLENGSPLVCKHRFSALYNHSYENLHCAWGFNPTSKKIWKFTQVTENACVSRGSIDSITFEERVYLKGLAVLVPEETCSKNSTFYFYSLLNGDVEFQNWLISSIICSAVNKFSCPSGKCLDLEKVCNNIDECMDGSGLDEHPALCNYSSRLVINRPRGLSQLKIATKRAHNRCPVFQYSMGVVVRCTKNNVIVNCTEGSVGTKLEMFCRPFYVPNSRIKSNVMTCNKDGLWAPFKPFSCKPDCGRIESNSKLRQIPYISGGDEVTTKFGFPWYAAIFSWRNQTGKFEFICGGSLIEDSIIITAAHCVVTSGGKKVASHALRVVLAPISSVFQLNVESNLSKILMVRRIWTPRTYNSFTLTSDIALVQLIGVVEYTASIQPVCYLTEAETRLPIVGTVGLIAGFGKDESNIVVDTLKWASFPVVSNTNCLTSLGINIYPNEFCAGYQNGTSACQGDSGGGLVFRQFGSTSETSPYVLKGIVSRGLTSSNGECVTNAVNVFTYIDSFGAWILETLTANDIF